MRIVAGGAVVDHPLSRPVEHSFAMGTAQPVTLLAEMALAAELVAVVKIDLPAFLVFQEIPLLRVVTINAAQPLALICHVRGSTSPWVSSAALLGGHRFIRMTAAAFVALDLSFSGQHPKRPALIFLFCQHRSPQSPA